MIINELYFTCITLRNHRRIDIFKYQLVSNAQQVDFLCKIILQFVGNHYKTKFAQINF